jgi:hypothetical protein
MKSKDRIHDLLRECCREVLAYIRERESLYPDGWVPATDVNDGLEINFSAVPKNSQDPSGQRGWLFATFARMLEDEGRVQYENGAAALSTRRWPMTLCRKLRPNTSLDANTERDRAVRRAGGPTPRGALPLRPGHLQR